MSEKKTDERKPSDGQAAKIVLFVPEVKRLKWCDRSPNPYADDRKEEIDIITDECGHEYWLDAKTERVVQVGPHAGRHGQSLKVAKSARLPISRLRELALALAGKAFTDFAKRRETLHPLEDNRRGEIYFFRWDDFTKPVPENEMPPFLQVALYADGRLASFTDTLKRI